MQDNGQGERTWATQQFHNMCNFTEPLIIFTFSILSSSATFFIITIPSSLYRENMDTTGENQWNRKVFNANCSKIKYVNHHDFCSFKDKTEHKLPVFQFCMPVSCYFASVNLWFVPWLWTFEKDYGLVWNKWISLERKMHSALKKKKPES